MIVLTNTASFFGAQRIAETSFELLHDQPAPIPKPAIAAAMDARLVGVWQIEQKLRHDVTNAQVFGGELEIDADAGGQLQVRGAFGMLSRRRPLERSSSDPAVAQLMFNGVPSISRSTAGPSKLTTG